MASASVSGLVSGLDTATIISQLMQVEAQPQTMLKSRLSTEQSTVSTLQALNARFATLASKAHDLTTTASWSPLTATSSSTQVSATAATTAVPGGLSFTVNSTAAAHRLSFGTTAKGSDVVVSPNVTLTRQDGSTVAVDAGTGTLDDLVAGLNANRDANVTASKVRLDDGSYRLSVVANETGAAKSFTLSDDAGGSALLASAAIDTAGKDAEIQVGADKIHSSSNTFSGLSTGLDVSIAAGTPAGTAVTVTVARNAAGAQAALQSLVDSANDILSAIDSVTNVDPAHKTAGPLAGDSVVRDLRSKVLDAVTRTADGTSLAGIGLQTDRTGKITFDSSTFASAYTADPNGVAAKLGAPSSATAPGFASRLEAVGKSASDSTYGVLTQTITGRQSSVHTMQDSIADWDIRLSDRKDALNRQFSALEVALGKMQDQASWLSGQIASLPSGK